MHLFINIYYAVYYAGTENELFSVDFCLKCFVDIFSDLMCIWPFILS